MNYLKKDKNRSSAYVNNATKVITSVLASIFALSGITHGFFEILQGNKPTPGFIIQAISIEYQRWQNGDEAFTLIPNFLITGIIAICIGILIIIWSIGFIHKKHGPIIFLLLFVMLIMAGGGLGFIPFILLTWLYSTRITKPLNWWGQDTIPENEKCIIENPGVYAYCHILTYYHWTSDLSFWNSRYNKI